MAELAVCRLCHQAPTRKNDKLVRHVIHGTCPLNYDLFSNDEWQGLMGKGEADDSLLRDAERYRFIRKSASDGALDICVTLVDWEEESASGSMYKILTEERADAAIDEAMAAR